MYTYIYIYMYIYIYTYIHVYASTIRFVARFAKAVRGSLLSAPAPSRREMAPMSRRLAQSCGLLGLCVVAGKHAAHCATVKTFKSNPHMMRGVKVKAESYEISFEGCGSVRVFRACDPPYEISFPQWSLKKSVSRSEVAVESVRALCSGELKDGTSCALLARAILLPDGAFKKIVVVSNLRKLLKEHLPKGSFKSIREAGSTLYRLDVDGSDHDIEVGASREAVQNLP